MKSSSLFIVYVTATVGEHVVLYKLHGNDVYIILHVHFCTVKIPSRNLKYFTLLKAKQLSSASLLLLNVDTTQQDKDSVLVILVKAVNYTNV